MKCHGFPVKFITIYPQNFCIHVLSRMLSNADGCEKVYTFAKIPFNKIYCRSIII